MQTAPIPANESGRIASLKRLQILDTPPEERFDRITKLATKVFNVPISTITLVDSNREWYKSVCGLAEKESDRAVSFCGHAMLEDEILIIPDAKKDPRFSDNPMVIGEPFIRFYAGVPLFSADGARIGTFCIKGHDPREITEDEKNTLKGLAKWTELEINSHNLSVALDQVKKSVEEIDTFFETSQDIMVIANTDGYFEKVNPAMMKILGYATEELTKNPFLSFVHPDDQKATLVEVEKLAKGAVTINFVNRYRARGGEYLWIQWNATPRRAQLYAIGRNISENKELEMQSKIQAERMEQISSRFTFATQSAKIGIWEWDVINNRLVWDDQMYALYGIKPEQFGGAYNAWQAGLHPDDKKSGDEAIMKALAGEKEFDTSFRVIWPDKSIHYIKAYGAVERDEKGVPQRMVGVNWDITKESVVDREKTEFVSLASHQLKTPIGSIQWNMEMILAGDYGEISKKLKDVLQETYVMSTRMNELVNALLNISRIEMGVFIIEPTLTDFAKLCDEVIVEMEPRRAKKGHELTKEFQINLPEVLADSKLLRIVFQNFISNAIKYTQDKGKIKVSLKTDDKNIIISVANNGDSIPQADQEKIFGKMFRASNAQRQDPDGNGLGLYMVKQIIHNAGGKIWFTSNEGEDTVFACSIPLTGMIAKTGSKQLA